MKYTYTLVHVVKGRIKIEKVKAHSAAEAMAHYALPRERKDK